MVSGTEITLTLKEYDLLLYFITNKNRFVTKESIAEHLWGDNIDMADSFDFMYTHIKNLRKKITEAGGGDYIELSVVGFIIGGFIFYHIIFSIVNKKADEDLKTEMELIEEQIIHSDSIPDFSPYFGHQILVTIFSHEVEPSYSLSDTILTDTLTGGDIPTRYMLGIANKNGKSYSIELFKPLIKTNLLIEDIFAAIFVIFMFLLLSSIVINYSISKKIWSPFYHTLKQINEY